MLQTQEYLRSHSLTDLENQFHITVKRHPKYNNLIHLKYNQIESPFGEPVVQECRSLILDENDNYKVISFPYKKFFNTGEGHAAEIDWSNAKIFEKADGSLITMYWYDNQWNVSTSGTPDADTPLPVGNETFKDCFWRVWNQLGYNFPRDKKSCYMFELMTPYNRVVVPQFSERIVLHGARNLETLKERDSWLVAYDCHWHCVKSFPLTSLDEVVKACEALNPMEQEGFVVCDNKFNRIKVKSPQYVALHHIQGSFSARRMLEIIKTNEQTEFLSYFNYFPEWKPLFLEIKSRYDSLVAEIQETYSKYKDISDQKTFAMAVKELKYSSVYFSLRSHKWSVVTILNKMNSKILESWLDLNCIQ